MSLSRAVPLSVLDLVPVGTGVNAAEALRGMLDLARHAERLGYTRYWLAEHHGSPGIASSATPILIGQVAAATSTIRVGSGGVMLPNHAPLSVAEQFGTLGLLFPGRVDLGVGRAPGTDAATARALRRTVGLLGVDDFPDQLAELITFLAGGTFPLGHPYHRVAAFPRAAMPPIWLLGSGGYSAQLAGKLGLPFAFAHHFGATDTLPALELYRSSFRPRPVPPDSGAPKNGAPEPGAPEPGAVEHGAVGAVPGCERPYVMVAAAVVCADDDEQAEWLARPIRLAKLRLRSRWAGAFPSPEEAAAYPWTDEERAAADAATSSFIVGSPQTVRAGLDRLVRETGADEIMVNTNVPAHADRIRSYELVAQLAGLPGSRAPGHGTGHGAPVGV